MRIEEGSITGSAAGMNVQPTGQMENKGRELGRKADQMGRQVRGRVGEAKVRLVGRVHDGRDHVTQEVQAHPTRALLWAVGAGALVGVLLARRARNAATTSSETRSAAV